MPHFHRWKDDFADRKVLIIGDVMLDEYIHGVVERISPEAPVPIVVEQRREHRLGGAANVAANLRGLHAHPYMLSVIGDDEAGRQLQHRLENNGIDAQFLKASPHRPTTIKTRVVGNHQQILRIDHETTAPLHPSDQRQLIQAALDLLSDVEAVLFEDYDKGVITPQVYAQVAAEARRRRIPILVDPKLRNFSSYRSATFFKPNLKELRDGLGIEITSPPSPEKLRAAAERLREVLQPQVAMITLSEYGIYATDYTEEHHVPAFVRKVADVSGAGDTTIAVTTLAHLAGYPLRDILIIANAAAAAVCEVPGVVPLDDHLMTRALEIIEKYQNHEL